MEHLNLLLKRAHSGGQSLATLGTLSLSLDLFLELDRTFSAQLDLEHSGTHKRPDNHVDVLALAKAIKAQMRRAENKLRSRLTKGRRGGELYGCAMGAVCEGAWSEVGVVVF